MRVKDILFYRQLVLCVTAFPAATAGPRISFYVMFIVVLQQEGRTIDFLTVLLVENLL